MYFTSGSDRAFEQLMQGKPGFDHYDSGEAVTPEDCGTCRFYRPHWKYQFCVYAECPYQPGKLTAYDAVTFRVKGVENMAVFRVERNKGYTVMSNHHLRNKDLSLKAKGLLSQMLSLPEDWDYTLKGLSLINREQIDAIRAAIRELEQAGYIVRSRERDSQGRLRGADYVIYEQPQPVPDSPTLENPMLDNPTQEKPTLGKPTQLNKDISSKEKSITDVSITDPIPILSRPSPLEDEAAQPPERKGTEAKSQSAIEIYRQIIMDNIEYEHLFQHVKGIDRETLDEIVDLLVETVCSARKTIRIAGDDYPAELVKSKFMKLDSSHIEFVFDCLSKNTSEIRNIKKYLLAILDPIQAYMGEKTDMNRANEVRPMFRRLADVAERTGCAVILIGHLNKAAGGQSAYRGLGSIDFRAAARSVLLIGRVKREPNVRVIIHDKSSLAPEGKPVAFCLDPETGFSWIGEYDITADELLSGAGGNNATKTEQAERLILDLLADGKELASEDIVKAAAEAGISERTVQNAKRGMGGILGARRVGGQWYNFIKKKQPPEPAS